MKLNLMEETVANHVGYNSICPSIQDQVANAAVNYFFWKTWMSFKRPGCPLGDLDVIW